MRTKPLEKENRSGNVNERVADIGRDNPTADLLEKEIEDKLAPIIFNSELPVSLRLQELKRFINSAVKSWNGLIPVQPAGTDSNVTAFSQRGCKIMDDTRDTSNSNLQVFAIKNVDGAFATAYTPIRLARKKDRDTLGVDYVVSPVRRSTRQLTSKTTDELERAGLKQVPTLGQVMETSGNFAFTPNRAL